MSMAGPYLSSPSSSSGGLYQSVITLFVYSLSLSSASYRRASPQSPSFIWPLKQITLSYRDGRRLKAMKAGTSIFFLVVKNLAKIGHKFETISIMLITFPFFFFSSFTITCVKIKITTVTCARENGKKHGDVKKLSSSSYQLRDGFIVFIQGGIVPSKVL